MNALIETNRALRIGSRINNSTAGSVLHIDSNNKLAEDAGVYTYDGTHESLKADNAKRYSGAGNDMSVFYDGADGNIKTNEVAASDLKIDCGVNKTVELSETVWEDQRVAVSETQANGSNPPSDALFINDGNEIPGTAYALSFLSTTQGNLTLPDNVNFDTSADFTFNFWVRPVVGTQQVECMRKNNVFEIDFRNANIFRWNVEGVGNINGTVQFNRGSWNMVTVKHDVSEAELTFYVNNQEDTVVSVVMPDNTEDFLFNRQETLYDVDYIEYWDKTLSDTEITNRYSGGAGDQLIGTETGLKGLWELNDGSGTTVDEKTGLASDGSITGGTEGNQWDWIGGHVGNSSTGSRGVILKYFSPDEVNEVYFTIQMPHAWKTGTAIKPHVHFATLVNGGTDETVRWGLEYTWNDINSIFGDTSFVYSSQQVDNTGTPIDITAYKHHYAQMSDISGSGISGVSSQLICRLFRDSEHIDDDFGDFAGLIEFDIHYEINTQGSRQEHIK